MTVLVCFDPVIGRLRSYVRFKRRPMALIYRDGQMIVDRPRVECIGEAMLRPWTELPDWARVVDREAIEAFRIRVPQQPEPEAA